MGRSEQWLEHVRRTVYFVECKFLFHNSESAEDLRYSMKIRSYNKIADVGTPSGMSLLNFPAGGIGPDMKREP